MAALLAGSQLLSGCASTAISDGILSLCAQYAGGTLNTMENHLGRPAQSGQGSAAHVSGFVAGQYVKLFPQGNSWALWHSDGGTVIASVGRTGRVVSIVMSSGSASNGGGLSCTVK